MAIDWKRGYTASWRVSRIDPATWEPCGELACVDSIEIERDATAEAPMLETATVKTSMAATDAFVPGWHRVYMEAVQGVYSASAAIATVWLDTDSSTHEKGRRLDELKGASVLKQASEAYIGDGNYAPNGVDAADWAVRTLAACIDAPVSAAGSAMLKTNVVFDLGATVLDAVWAVLREVGWIIAIDGRGEVTVQPMPTEPALALDREGSRILMPSVSVKGETVAYKREWLPDVPVFSIVRGTLPANGLDGDYRVTAQRLTCGRGIVVEESAVRI